MDSRQADRGPTCAPINTLPAEVLAHIMWILVSCAHRDEDVENWGAEDIDIPYPEALSEVCSHWRQIVTHSHYLWSFIHLQMSHLPRPGSRTMAFLDRVCQAPLHLRLSDGNYNYSPDLTPFLSPIIPQLKSLGMTAYLAWGSAHKSVFSACIAGCTAGKLTELAIQTRHVGDPFYDAPELQSAISSWSSWVDVDLPYARLEDVLRRVTTLRLFRIYPPWTSQAYHGLVELRLMAGRSGTTYIAEDQLIGILRASPQLHVLHFDLPIKGFLSLDATIADLVILEELEILKLAWRPSNGVEVLLRWLAPSPKLRQFSFNAFDCGAEERYFTHPATIAFLAGSGITRVHAKSMPAREIISLIHHCPHVQELAYENIVRHTEESIPFRLKKLYIIRCSMDLDALCRLVQPGLVQNLIIYCSNIGQEDSWLSIDQIISALYDVCSNILVPLPLHKDPGPTAEWDVSWGDVCDR